MFLPGIFKNTLYQFLTKVTTSATTLFITIIIAHSLSASGYGDFTKVITFVTIFYMVSDFGLNAIYLQEKNVVSFSTLFHTRLFLSALLLVGINIVSWMLPYNTSLGAGFSAEVKLGILIYSITVLTQALITSSSAIFQDKKRYQDLFIATLFGSVGVVALVLILLAKKSPQLSDFLLAMVAGGILSAGVAFFLTDERVNFASVSRVHVKKLLMQSTPLGLMLLFNLVYFRADVLLLSVFKSSADVGVYGLSYRFFDFLIALPLFLSNSLYPHLLENAKNTRTFNYLIKRYIVVSVIISIGLVILFWVISPLFTVIAHDFTHAIMPFRILLLSLPIFFCTSIVQWGLIAKKQQQFLLWTYVLAGAINIVLNVVYIPAYSYVASALLTAICELLVLVILSVKLLFLSEKYAKRS